ncbi:MAG TPA: hypothetical protein VLH12_04115 [Usitatibacter sp.]|nr:hypothetical protein [Usitatibacter sp.]
MASRAVPWLLALAIACAIASFAIDRFGYELCHRGLPLASLTVATPIVGAIAGLVAFFRRSRAWVIAIKVAALAVNGWQLASALIVLTGVGIATCG